MSYVYVWGLEGPKLPDQTQQALLSFNDYGSLNQIVDLG